MADALRFLRSARNSPMISQPHEFPLSPIPGEALSNILPQPVHFQTRQQPLHRLKLFGRQRIPQLIQHRQFLLGSKSCWLSYFGFLAIRPVFPILIFVRTPARPTAPKTA
jgi:hypothetical protein